MLQENELKLISKDLKQLLVRSFEQFGDRFTISNSNIREQQGQF